MGILFYFLNFFKKLYQSATINYKTWIAFTLSCFALGGCHLGFSYICFFWVYARIFTALCAPFSRIGFSQRALHVSGFVMLGASHGYARRSLRQKENLITYCQRYAALRFSFIPFFTVCQRFFYNTGLGNSHALKRDGSGEYAHHGGGNVSAQYSLQ